MGEPSTTKIVEICNQKKANTGLASEKEFPHIAIINLQSRLLTRNNHESLSKCVGSLISDRHVLTSMFCISSDQNFHLSVRLGAYKLDENNISNIYDVEHIEAKHGVAILKLNRKVNFSEQIMPICIFPDKEAAMSILLSGWTGDWRECDPKLKKWQIENYLVKRNRWQFFIDETSIINYRQVR